ncbi:MAG: BBE domain-containing protein [Geodermatophilaceae bacterium]
MPTRSIDVHVGEPLLPRLPADLRPGGTGHVGSRLAQDPLNHEACRRTSACRRWWTEPQRAGPVGERAGARGPVLGAAWWRRQLRCRHELRLALHPAAPIRHEAGRLGARPRHLGKDRIKASFVAAKYERLTQIKATYDPDNVFRSNVNIPPAS